MTSRRPAQKGSEEYWPRNLPWAFVGSLVAVLFVAMKVAAASKWNVSTGLALIDSVGVIEVITGVLLVQLPALVTLIGLVLIIWVARPDDDETRPRYGPALAIGWIFIALSALIGRPWVEVLILSAGTGFLLWFTLKSGQHAKRMMPFVIIFVGVFSLLEAVRPNVWLPPEIIQTVQDGQVVGYVTSVESEWTTILTERDRRIVRFRSAAVLGRQVCDLYLWDWGQSVLQLLLGSANNPPCFAKQPTSPPPSSPSP